jgi:hypothetical protein
LTASEPPVADTKYSFILTERLPNLLFYLQ